MLSRFISTPSRHLRTLSLALSHQLPSFPSPSPSIPRFQYTHLISRHFSNANNNNKGNGEGSTSDFWKMTQDSDELGAVYGDWTESSEVGNEERETMDKNSKNGQKPTSDLWKMAPDNDELSAVFGDSQVGGMGRESTKGGSESSWDVKDDGDNLGVFEGFEDGDGKGFRERESGGVAGDDNDWILTSEFKKWTLGEARALDVFDIGDAGAVAEGAQSQEEREDKKAVDNEQLLKEEGSLTAVLKGPNRAFGDLVAASGITDDMLDSLIALKDFKDIDGLPPLPQIEDERYYRSLKKSSRHEMELQKQEEAAKARVRQVDEKERAYGTGRRKCSIARVWIQPGEGKFLVNDKEFDVYFPMLDQRAALLRPFSETKTLGLWDIHCTVKGGGVSGQVGAIRLGISRALQNWEPGLRPALREAGFLTRDPRVVERKKPGKAKARKSFQWVKR